MAVGKVEASCCNCVFSLRDLSDDLGSPIRIDPGSSDLERDEMATQFLQYLDRNNLHKSAQALVDEYCETYDVRLRGITLRSCSEDSPFFFASDFGQQPETESESHAADESEYDFKSTHELQIRDEESTELFGRELLQAVAGWEKSEKRRAAQVVSRALGLMVEHAKGGALFVIAPCRGWRTAEKDKALKVQHTDGGFMREQIGDFDIFSAEFANLFTEFTQHSEKDVWPEGHAGAGRRKDGGFAISAKGRILKPAAKFLTNQVDVKFAWPGKGLRHTAALSLAAQLPEAIVLVRSEEGSVHLLTQSLLGRQRALVARPDDFDRNSQAAEVESKLSELRGSLDNRDVVEVEREAADVVQLPVFLNDDEKRMWSVHLTVAIATVKDASEQFKDGRKREAVDLMDRSMFCFTCLVGIKCPWSDLDAAERFARFLATPDIVALLCYMTLDAHSRAAWIVIWQNVLEVVQADGVIEGLTRMEHELQVAFMFRELGRIEDAKVLCEGVLQFRAAHYQDNGSKLPIAHAMHALSVVCGALGTQKDGVAKQDLFVQQKRLASSALQIKEEQLGKNDIKVARTHLRLGQALGNLGQHQEAEAHFEQALVIANNDDHSELFAQRIKVNLALIRGELGSWSEARDLLTAVLEVQKRLLGPDHRYVADTKSNLGVASGHLNEKAEQQRFHDEAAKMSAKRTERIEGQRAAEARKKEKRQEHLAAQEEAAIPAKEALQGRLTAVCQRDVSVASCKASVARL